MTYALVSGVLVKDPEQRTSKNGNAFMLANIRAKDGEATVYYRIFVFSEGAIAELSRLGEGDAVSFTGTLKSEIYVPEGGTPRVSHNLTADRALGMRPPPKERKKPGYHAIQPEIPLSPTRLPRTVENLSRQIQPEAIDPALNDEIPWG